MEIDTMRRRWINAVALGISLLLLWWILAEGVSSSLWIGVPAILLAVTISSTFVSFQSFVWPEAIKFLFFFVVHSLRGGVDVARRVFQRDMSISPVLFEYTLQLPLGFPRVLMANSVGLLPGTLSVELEQNKLTVHVLDGRVDFLAELKAVEQHVARMFGQPIDHQKGIA
jgi:multicomponent Na+:H+ antiporter subunit E